MPRLCSLDGCERKHVARGLCSMHYNAAHRKPNPVAEFECPTCGKTFTKERARANRYKNLYCSQLCRDYATFGHGTTCKLPPDHWARWVGATCAFKPKTIVECVWCGGSSVSQQPNTMYCTRKCQKASSKAARRGREHGAYGTYTWGQVVSLWVMFGKACAYCTLDTPLAEIQAEHVTPLSKQGANNLSNLLPSCAPCNSDKRDLLLSEWNADRQRRGLPPRQVSWEPTDQRYMHLTHAHTLAA